MQKFVQRTLLWIVPIYRSSLKASKTVSVVRVVSLPFGVNGHLLHRVTAVAFVVVDYIIYHICDGLELLEVLLRELHPIEGVLQSRLEGMHLSVGPELSQAACVVDFLGQAGKCVREHVNYISGDGDAFGLHKGLVCQLCTGYKVDLSYYCSSDCRPS